MSQVLLKNIFICISKMNRSHTGLDQHEGKKNYFLRQNFYFW